MNPESARGALVASLAKQGILTDARVRAALLGVPREAFVAHAYADWAYLDEPLPLPSGQTISAPHMVALMAQALDLQSGHKVLEIGGGSGYHAAVAAQLVAPGGHVFSIERIPALAQQAREALTRLGYAQRVTVVEGDGSLGLPDEAPFDRIFVACASPRVPAPLLEQLSPGGKLLVPVGSAEHQELLLLTRGQDGELHRRPLGGCRFVPLIGAHGFQG